jgi:nicotinate-nucleotide adenylyltransferase
MRIGFFGGSFDPPHLGHLAVGHAAAEEFSLDRVLFAPTGRQPLKPEGPSAPFENRLAMVALLCDLHAQPNCRVRFEASSLDAPLADGSPNYTIQALSTLHNQSSPDDSFFMILGADAFLELPRWKSADTLLQLAEWIVVSRPGVVMQPLSGPQLDSQQRHRVHLLRGVHEPASATKIRELLHAGSDCTNLLPGSILHYIRAHHLYGT